MDRKEYENLYKKNHEFVIDFIKTYIYKEGKEGSFANEVAIFTLAVILKEIKDYSLMIHYLENHIDDEATSSFLKKVNKNYQSLIEEISKKFDLDTLKGAALFSESTRFTERDLYSTPKGVSNLALSLLSLTKDDVLLDLGSGVNSFLIQAAITTDSNTIYGVEINTESLIIANMRSLIAKLPIKVFQGNMVSQGFTHLLANKVFSNYPLGMRLPQLEKHLNQNSSLKKFFKGAKRTVSSDWIFGIAAYLNMKKPGKTVILMSGAGTWNKPDQEIRKELVEKGIVEGVILLPPILLPSTGISLNMVVLSQNNKEVKMVDATKIYTKGRRQNFLESKNVETILKAYQENTSISKNVKITTLAKQDYILNPLRYIGLDINIIDGIPLGKLCKSINRGAMIMSSELDSLMSKEKTSYSYLMLQNIHDGVIDKTLPSLKCIEEKYRKYCVKNNNLIISKISPFKIAVIHLNEDEKVLASGNLYFIDLDENKVNPIFIKLFLESENGMAQLNRLAKGGVVKTISIQDLKMIQIPNITRKKQNLIAQEYENLCDELIVLQRQSDMIRDKKSRLIEEVF